MEFQYEDNKVKLIAGTLAFSLFFAGVCFSALILTPGEEKTPELIPVAQEAPSAFDAATLAASDDEAAPSVTVVEKSSGLDTGLAFYKLNPEAVVWYYSGVTGDREVAEAIIENSAKHNIPLSLAFALAYTESRFNIKATHVNQNKTIDRGLFQLNSDSFQKLSEEDFFDPRISAKYGLAHLKFCLNSGENEIAALAMYNAGAKIRKNGTPMTTLNYIAKIQNYRLQLEENFATEVLALYDVGSTRLIAKNK